MFRHDTQPRLHRSNDCRGAAHMLRIIQDFRVFMHRRVLNYARMAILHVLDDRSFGTAARNDRPSHRLHA